MPMTHHLPIAPPSRWWPIPRWWLCLGLGILVTGCTGVKPWQKQHLAERSMRFDPDPEWAKLRRHMYDSKEGSTGGFSIGGGGCGCG
jgi:hypothetical protein